MSELPGIATDSPLLRPLREVPGIVAHVERTLNKEGVKTVADVLAHLPFRHEDRIRMEGQTFHASETPSCHRVIVMKTGVKFFGPRRGGNFEAVVQHTDANALGQQLTLRWWSMPWLSKSLAEGMELIVYGVIKDYKGRLSIVHPEYEVLKGGDDDESATIHTGRITPIYRLNGGMTQKALRVAAWHVGASPAGGFCRRSAAQAQSGGRVRGHGTVRVHCGKCISHSSMETLEVARRYLALEEFYGYQLRVAHRRRQMIASGGRSMDGRCCCVISFIKSLPFRAHGRPAALRG